MDETDGMMRRQQSAMDTLFRIIRSSRESLAQDAEVMDVWRTILERDTGDETDQ